MVPSVGGSPSPTALLRWIDSHSVPSKHFHDVQQESALDVVMGSNSHPSSEEGEGVRLHPSSGVPPTPPPPPFSFQYFPQRNRNHQVIWIRSPSLSAPSSTSFLLSPTTIHVAYGFQHIQNVVRQLRKRKTGGPFFSILSSSSSMASLPPRLARRLDAEEESVVGEVRRGAAAGGPLSFALEAEENIEEGTHTNDNNKKNEPVASAQSLRERLLQLRAGPAGFRAARPPYTTALRGGDPSAGRNASSSVASRDGWKECTFLEIMACPDGCWNGGGQLPLPPSRLSTTTTTAASPLVQLRSPSSDACRTEEERGGGDEKKVKSALERVVEKAGEWLTEIETKAHLHEKNENGTCTWLSHPTTTTTTPSSSLFHSCASSSPRELPATTTTTIPAEELPSDAEFSPEAGDDFCYAFAYSIEGLREAAEREKRNGGEEESDGKCMWECIFKDRRAEFEELLNQGGVHTLQW